MSNGTAVLVNGEIVAWFANFDESAEDWCRDNHFGNWLTWRATPPETIPLTTEEQELVDANVAKFAEFFNRPEEDAEGFECAADAGLIGGI
jgi:hypothetical protein